jgi:enoyl-CoA hydratase/carnithine racemase
MSTDKILVDRNGAVGIITFNNPAKLNAVSLDMWEAVYAALDEFETDDSIRALVLTGAGGRAFVSGADISKFESERATKEGVEAYGKMTKRCYDRIEAFPKPTIAKINGYCIGGGLNLALCCDIRICSDKSRFALPAAKLSLGYGLDSLRRLVNVLGPGATRDICYSARQINADEAYARRLADQVVTEAELDQTVEEYAANIASNAPLTIAAMKFVTCQLLKDPADRDVAKCDELVQACFDSEDYIEGRRAFMEKRKPDFKGA